MIVVLPIWQRYLSTYPEVQLEVWSDVGRVDLVASGFDAGIGPADWAPSDMIGVRVTGPIKMAVVGAPTYFAAAAITRAWRPCLAQLHSISSGSKGPTCQMAF
jgi:DNA-binding transcriptional LysR family regulator